MRTNPTPQEHDTLDDDDLARLQEILSDAENSSRLNGWEEEFCDSLRDRVLEYGARARVSAKQWDIIDRIEANYMAFKKPNSPPAFTGTLWLRPDKTIGGVISDVFNTPIHLIATKEGSEYRVLGWRGNAPGFQRIPLLDDPRPDGLPDDAPAGPCKLCEGRLYWRAAFTNGIWNCATCTPADDKIWLDGLHVGS